MKLKPVTLVIKTNIKSTMWAILEVSCSVQTSKDVYKAIEQKWTEMPVQLHCVAIQSKQTEPNWAICQLGLYRIADLTIRPNKNNLLYNSTKYE